MIFDLIDTRAFGSLWYWILVAAAWGMVTRRVLDVPLDLAFRARVDAGAEVLVRGLLAQRRVPGLPRVVLVSCALTVLLLLGFGEGYELAQAVALIAVPVTLVRLLDLSAARRARAAPDGPMLAQVLLSHHVVVQVVAFAVIGGTAWYGMRQIVRAHFLGT
ncbi:component of SufBCD complex [Paenirhodobacter sp.]|uniref:component of SufBCD complex n=1 Tax=Paenirhodobacter sp. TaxID=1965326 RepID=UPI003B3FCF52